MWQVSLEVRLAAARLFLAHRYFYENGADCAGKILHEVESRRIACPVRWREIDEVKERRLGWQNVDV